jgi:ATP synthase protein I
MLLRLRSRPFRTVLRWQLVATAAFTLIFGFYAGLHGALSGALGGLIGVAGGGAFAALGSLADGKPAGTALVAMLRAEAVKIGLMVLLLGLVLTTYTQVVVLGLITSFLVSALIFSMAAFVRDN